MKSALQLSAVQGKTGRGERIRHPGQQVQVPAGNTETEGRKRQKFGGDCCGAAQSVEAYGGDGSQ